MDFDHNEEQSALRDLARQILEDGCTKERLRELEESDLNLDRALWAELARANLTGIAIPEAQGGMGMGFAELATLLEEVGRAVAPVPAFSTLVLGALPIARFGSDAQKSRWLSGVSSGEVLLTGALSEEGAWDPRNPYTRAEPKDTGFRIDGVKLCVPIAASAARIVVSARGEGGTGLFLVDPQASGVTLEALATTAHEPQHRVALQGVAVPAEDVLVAPDAGSDAVQWLAEHAIAALAAMQVGVCESALRRTAEYTATREQFNRKISTFQAVAQRAANAYIDVECLTLTTREAVWKLAQGAPASDEVAIAKYWVGETGHRVSYAAQHLHGGIGIDVDYPLHRYCLWAKALELAAGSSVNHLEALGDALAAG